MPGSVLGPWRSKGRREELGGGAGGPEKYWIKHTRGTSLFGSVVKTLPSNPDGGLDPWLRS